MARRHAEVVATGRSDWPNQVNSALVVPGVFRGALEHEVTRVTTPMLLAAADALAALVEEPSAEEIVPSLLDERVVPAVARAVGAVAAQEAAQAAQPQQA